MYTQLSIDKNTPYTRAFIRHRPHHTTTQRYDLWPAYKLTIILPPTTHTPRGEDVVLESEIHFMSCVHDL